MGFQTAHANIAFMPVALPRFTGQDQIRANFHPGYTSSIWDQDHLVESYVRDGLPYDSPRSWLPEARERLPSVVEFVEQHLPFETICIAKILRSTDTRLNIHVDIGKYDWPGLDFYQHQYDMAPAAYRVILDGEGPRILFYTDAPDTPREHWRWAEMPPDTNTFVHSAVDSLHGAEYYPGLNRYILFIHGRVNLKRHRAILARSLARYPQQALTFDDLRW